MTPEDRDWIPFFLLDEADAFFNSIGLCKEKPQREVTAAALEPAGITVSGSRRSGLLTKLCQEDVPGSLFGRPRLQACAMTEATPARAERRTARSFTRSFGPLVHPLVHCAVRPGSSWPIR